MKHVRRRPALPRPVGLPLIAGFVFLCMGASPPAPIDQSGTPRPNVLIITVDTLRADRLSAFGYQRETSPHMDRLIVGGVNFVQARTVEPLTSPALCSMFTSRPPHQHGATRNGLRMWPGLASFPNVLREHGYRTAAFVSNWTLRNKVSGLAEHFENFEEVLTRKRWFGLIRREATAWDVIERSLDWIEDHVEHSRGRPFLAWLHFVEPHAPYRLQKDFVSILKSDRRDDFPATDRYDTEIAYVDAAIGELLERLEELSPAENTLIVFTSDHGESLGEHGYWGHGRHLYEPTLRIPMALHWKGRLPATKISAPSLNIDLAPTILRLLGLPVPAVFEGYNWMAVLQGISPPPDNRITRYEAHRGAVITRHKSELARRSGLLEIALLQDHRKEIFRIKGGRHYVFDLSVDPGELNALVPTRSDPTDALLGWMRIVYNGLTSHGDLPPEPLDEEGIAALRSLGYVD